MLSLLSGKIHIETQPPALIETRFRRATRSAGISSAELYALQLGRSHVTN